jgi:ABC-type molybdate transport system substrate-binding protein
MRRVLFLFTVALVMAVPESPTVAACGNKFLQIGRGVIRYDYAPRYSAAVLVFAPSRSGATPLFKDQKIQPALGLLHKVVVVQDEAGLAKALQAGHFDLALVGQTDLVMFGHAADTVQRAPTVLPVMNKPTKTVMEACKRQYDCDLKTSDRLDDFLKVMDDAMKVRTKGVAGQKR